MRQAAQTVVHSESNSRLRDYVVLCKPRISVMVILTVIVGGLLSGAAGHWMVLLNASIGVLLLAASGSAMNQYLERYTDFLMPRTAQRPLPGGRLSASEVVVFAAVTFGVGIAVMWMLCNLLVLSLGFATWVLYVWVYTPLKLRSVYNTMVGAIPGAMPILIGAAAGAEGVSATAWSFFAVLLIWQLPHFMSIAWLYRKDYAEGNMKMITVTDPSCFWAAVWAIGFSAMLLPVSVIPAWQVETWTGSIIMLIAGIALGGWYLLESIRFSRQVVTLPQQKRASKSDGRRDELATSAARRLLKVSLLYLPLYMFALVLSVLI